MGLETCMYTCVLRYRYGVAKTNKIVAQKTLAPKNDLILFDDFDGFNLSVFGFGVFGFGGFGGFTDGRLEIGSETGRLGLEAPPVFRNPRFLVCCKWAARYVVIMPFPKLSEQDGRACTFS